MTLATPPNTQSLLALQDLTVIVVTYNSAHCIDALALALKNFPHVSVVDNASNDGCADLAQQRLPQARVFRNARNMGFGAANNVALREVTTPYALLLNPDCEVSEASALALLEVARTLPDAAIVAPQLLRDNREPHINYRWPSTHWSPKGPGAQGLCSVGFICGAALLLNMAVMRPIGFFDEAFFLYYEDDDLCQRVFAAKKSMVIAPHVGMLHASRGSVRGSSPWRAEYWRGYHHAQSKIRFTAKHVSVAHAHALRRRVLLLAMLSMPLRLLLPSPAQIARLAGRVAGLWQMALPRA